MCGAYYVVTTVTHGRQPHFAAATSASLVVAELDRCAEEGAVDPIAWVVMPDHLHWLFRLANGSLSASIQRMKSRSGRTINASRGATGPLWQAGFHDQQIRNLRHVDNAARYIVANPVRRGLVGRIEDYPFWWCCGVEFSSDWQT